MSLRSGFVVREEAEYEDTTMNTTTTSEGDDDENECAVSPTKLNGYDPAQTEALAALIAAGGNVPGRDPDLKTELLRALSEKENAGKELKAERESLANAKLIISSLEKANKSLLMELKLSLTFHN